MKKQISVHLEEEVVKTLKIAAKKEDVSVNFLVVDLLYLAMEQSIGGFERPDITDYRYTDLVDISLLPSKFTATKFKDFYQKKYKKSLSSANRMLNYLIAKKVIKRIDRGVYKKKK